MMCSVKGRGAWPNTLVFMMSKKVGLYGSDRNRGRTQVLKSVVWSECPSFLRPRIERLQFTPLVIPDLTCREEDKPLLLVLQQDTNERGSESLAQWRDGELGLLSDWHASIYHVRVFLQSGAAKASDQKRLTSVNHWDRKTWINSGHRLMTPVRFYPHNVMQGTVYNDTLLSSALA